MTQFKNALLAMQFFRYKEDIIPASLFVALIVADFVVYFFATNIYILLIWLFLVTLPKLAVCCFNHHHQHIATFYQTILNRFLEIVYALHTGITTNAWVLHHNLGHHVHYLDQTKDESGWKRKDGSIMGVIEYTLTIALTGYPRAYQVGKKYPKHQIPFVYMTVLVALLVMALVIHNPLNALFVFIIPMAIGYLVTCWHTYSHHATLDTEDHLEASHNIMDSWYNLFSGNLGYHTAHHMKPGLHWSKLPEYHASIEAQIPPALFCEAPMIFQIFRVLKPRSLLTNSTKL